VTDGVSAGVSVVDEDVDAVVSTAVADPDPDATVAGREGYQPQLVVGSVSRWPAITTPSPMTDLALHGPVK
jgi:hypothetical protein